MGNPHLRTKSSANLLIRKVAQLSGRRVRNVVRVANILILLSGSGDNS